jgi:hypothetical protein
MVWQDEFFVNNPLGVKGNDDMLLTFALHLVSPVLGLGELGLPVHGSRFRPRTLA